MKLNSRGLLALTLPDNLEQPLLRLQRRLFSELGLISALALPPLLPLLWTRAAPTLEDLRTLAHAGPVAVTLTERALTREGREIVVPVTVASPRGAPMEGEAVERLAAVARSVCAEVATEPLPFPPLRGIRIASDQASPIEDLEVHLRELSEAVPAGESAAISVASLEITLMEEEQWWRHLFFREIARKRFVRKRAG